MPLGLNIPLQGVETQIPSLSPGEYKSTITKVEGKESKNKPGLFMLGVELQLEQPTKSTKGKDIAPGHKFFYNVTLPGADPAEEHHDLRMRSTAAFIDAALGCTKENRPDLNDDLLPTFVGKTVKAVVKLRTDGDDTYGDSQVSAIKPFIAAPAA